MENHMRTIHRILKNKADLLHYKNLQIWFHSTIIQNWIKKFILISVRISKSRKATIIHLKISWKNQEKPEILLKLEGFTPNLRNSDKKSKKLRYNITMINKLKHINLRKITNWPKRPFTPNKSSKVLIYKTYIIIHR